MDSMYIQSFLKGRGKYYPQIVSGLLDLIGDGFLQGRKPVEISCGVIGYNVFCRACHFQQNSTKELLLTPNIPRVVDEVNLNGFILPVKIDYNWATNFIGMKFSDGKRYHIELSIELTQFINFHTQLN